MTSRELTSVAIKVFAIYIIVQAIFSVPLFANALVRYGFFENDDPNEILLWLIGIASIIVVIVLAILMWKLANRIISQANASNEGNDVSVITEGFLISLLGLYLIIKGLLQFGYASSSSYMILQAGGEVTAQNISYVVGNLIQVVIGISLIIKAQGWVSFLKWLRTAGLKGKA